MSSKCQALISVACSDREDIAGIPWEYRLGNLLFRFNYSDQFGVPHPEPTWFSHQNPELDLSDLSEHHTIDELGACDSIYYQLPKLEPQRTPHACQHAADFMTMEYARTYYQQVALQKRVKEEALSDQLIRTLRYFSHYSDRSGFDSGVGCDGINDCVTKFGLFNTSRHKNYGTSSKTIIMPDSITRLKEILCQRLYENGPFTIQVKEKYEPYGHAVTLCGVTKLDGQTYAIYADPWEGWMKAEPFESFKKGLDRAMQLLNSQSILISTMSKTRSASFLNREKYGYPITQAFITELLDPPLRQEMK